MTSTQRLCQATLCLAGLLCWPGCGGGNSISSGQGQPTFTATPATATVSVNGTQAISAQVSGDGVGTPQWSIARLDTGPVEPGSLSSSSGTEITYTAPASPPLYGQADPSIQGKIFLEGSVAGAFGSANGTVTLTVIAPSITTGIDPASATLPLGGTLNFAGYAVGVTSNAITHQVNGVAGGSAATGFIGNTSSNLGNYTAPLTMPPSGNTVTITAVSASDPTKSSSATVTLQ